jgi:NAD(P)-dependent dehydrogenase (short-subunit alcohol dehydrogenase family)
MDGSRMNNDLAGKTYILSGATSGIGLALAENLVKQGASIIGIGRSIERCKQTESHLKNLNPESKSMYLTCDLSLQSQIRSAAAQISTLLNKQRKKYLDGLVNIASSFAFWFVQTAEGFETEWAVNHLAPFLLTHELLPLLKQAPTSRIITVSSHSHYGGRIHWQDVQLRRCYNGLRAYEQSKLANVLFTVGLNQRLGASSTVRAFAADPGLVKTDIGLKNTPLLVHWAWKLRRSAGDPPEKPASAIAFLLTDPTVANSREVYWKNCAPIQPSKRALNLSSAERLWQLSEQMCGLQPNRKAQ